VDSLKSLLDKKQYDLVLSLTEGCQDAPSLIYRASAYLAKGDGLDAEAILVTQRDILYSYNPAMTLKFNFEVRFVLKHFDLAYEDLAYFNEKPYVSQEVEEYLRALPNLIRTNERSSELAKNYAPEEIDRILVSSKDDYEVLTLLNYLQNVPLRDYYGDIKTVLVSERNPMVKTYALLLLVGDGYSQEVTFNKEGKVYHLIPKDLLPPYTGATFDDFVRNLSSMAADPSVASVAGSLLNDYILDVYPETVIRAKDDRLLMTALLKLAREYLHSSLGIEGYLEMYHLDRAAVEAKAAEIGAVLAQEKLLKI
jgi:hypothetical protein